jgi:DNA-binding MarR family transcriptional regulator
MGMDDEILMKLLDLRIPWSAFRIILALRDGPRRSGELAQITGQEKSQTSKGLYRLVRLGIVETYRDDGRTYFKLCENFFTKNN